MRRSAAAVLLLLAATACSGGTDGAPPSSVPNEIEPSTTTTIEPPPPLTPALAAIARRTTMTDLARDLFARSEPELVPKDQLTRRCTIPEQTNVLGCFDGQRIAVLDVTDPRLDGMEEVTSAHELLHAVWEALEEPERQRLTPLLRSAYERSTDEDLRDKVEAYRRRDPTVVDHELHSILGTEVAALAPELELHYARWFVDRSAVVALAAASQGAFDLLEAQIAELDAQLRVLGDEIAAAESTLETTRLALTARAEQLEALRSAGRTDEYNAGVDPYNATVRSYNAAVGAQRRRVDRYNGTVAVRNALGADHDELVSEVTTGATPVLDGG